MPALSTWAENTVVSFLVNGVSPTAPSSWFMALYLTNPTAADTGTEVSTSGGTNYARMPITFTTPTSGSVSNVGEIDFPLAGATWGNVTYAGIRDSGSAGHLLFYGALTTPKYVASGDVLSFLIGNVVCTIS